MPEPVLRPTVEDDEEFLWEMLFYASHSYEEPGVGVDDIRSNPDLISYIAGWRSLDRFGVIAETDGLVGAAWLRRLTEQDVGNPVYLDPSTPELAIAVLRDLVGQGIGSTMLGRLIDESRERFPGIVLSAREGNPALRLYERHGFEITGTMVNRVGTRSVKMLLDLT